MISKKFTSLLVVILLNITSALALDLNVGETTVLDLGKIDRFEKCQWRISRPDAVKFVNQPDSYTSSVTIEALKPLDGACIIECTYYYYSDINPQTGEHMFLRSKTKRWDITTTLPQ